MNHEKYQLTIPRPPSVNGLYASNFKTKRRFKSKKYTEWIKEAELSLLGQERQEFKGNVVVKISIGKINKRKTDISNFIKATEDFLVDNGIIEDDSKVVLICAWWAYNTKDCTVSIGTKQEQNN